MTPRGHPDGAPGFHWCPENLCWSVNGIRKIPRTAAEGPPQTTNRRAEARPLLVRKEKLSALGELEAAAGFHLAVLLALDHAAVAGEEATALEGAAQVRLKIGQRLGDAVAHRARLSRKPTARDRAGHVVLAGAVGG